MNDNRHTKLGFKQTIRIEWMDEILNLLLAGHSESDIRKTMDQYLSQHKQSGGTGERGKVAYKMAMGLLCSWLAEFPVILEPMNNLRKLAKITKYQDRTSLHWSVLALNYPFWFFVSLQVGRLLSLQDKIKQKQIFNRLIEKYGDKETVSRNARYAVRSLVAWGMLHDDKKGCYIKGEPILVSEQVAIALIESAVYAQVEGKMLLEDALYSPAFFAFQFPLMTVEKLRTCSSNLDVISFGTDSVLLKIK